MRLFSYIVARGNNVLRVKFYRELEEDTVRENKEREREREREKFD